MVTIMSGNNTGGATMRTRSLTYTAYIIALILVFEHNGVVGVTFTRVKNYEASRCGGLLCEHAVKQNMDERVILSLSLIRKGNPEVVYPEVIITLSKHNNVVRSNQINGVWYPTFASIYFNTKDEKDCKLELFSCESLIMDNAGYTRKTVSTIWPLWEPTKAEKDLLPDIPYTQMDGKRDAKSTQATASKATLSTEDTRPIFKRAPASTSDTCTAAVNKLGETVNTMQKELSQLIGRRSWTVIQRRTNIRVDMNKNYLEYQNGFSEDGVYWMGLKRIQSILSPEPHEVMFTFSDIYYVRHAHYAKIEVAWAVSWYMLKLGKFVDGNTNDGLYENNYGSFCTTDQKIGRIRDCVMQQKAGWWYGNDGNCRGSNFNTNDLKLIWVGDKNLKKVRFTEIKVRPIIG